MELDQPFSTALSMMLEQEPEKRINFKDLHEFLSTPFVKKEFIEQTLQETILSRIKKIHLYIIQF